MASACIQLVGTFDRINKLTMVEIGTSVLKSLPLQLKWPLFLPTSEKPSLSLLYC